MEALDGDSCSMCDAWMVSRGFDLGWSHLNHRISLWELRPALESCPADDETIPLAVSYIGGDYTTDALLEDVPFFGYAYSSVQSSCSLGFVRATLSFDLGPDNRRDSRSFSLDAPASWDPEAPLVGLIQGIRISTDGESPYAEGYAGDYDPADGYTLGGIGAGIDEVRLLDGRIQGIGWAHFTPRATIPQDRPDMDEAIDYAVVHMEVDFTIISLSSGEATRQSHGYVLDYGSPSHLHLPHADADIRSMTIHGAGDDRYPSAFVGLASFDFDLFGGDEAYGDYIRELSVRATMIGYSPSSGEAEIDLDGYASNHSLIVSETMINDFSADVVLIQHGAGGVRSGHANGSFDTGSTTVEIAPW